ncbi:MAG TPA: hypothetical protein VKV04_05215 [Verrucomicrobiae bacterium]|nr:hypothetical protein [Verrucomicrobiae bacterium]
MSKADDKQKSPPDEDVEKALAMAEEYSTFAPGRLIPIDIHEKGDEAYEQLVVKALATVSFLFPQLGFEQRKSLVALITATEELRNTWSSENEKIHAIKLGQYERNVKDSLTPFQIALVEQRCRNNK